MMSVRYRQTTYCRLYPNALKACLAAALLVGSLAGGAAAQAPSGGGDDLQARLLALLRDGKTADAVREAQTALRRDPRNPHVRREYVNLHLSLAREWLLAQRYADCEAAVQAVLAVDKANVEARHILAGLRSARADAAREAAEVDRLLRLELFEAALDRIRAVRALQPGLGDTLDAQEQAARLGAADDHYLARNFHEAFALYESVLAADPASAAGIHSRWALSLALALAEADFTREPDPDAAGRLLARAVDVLRRTREPILGQIIGGLLAEQAGHKLEAGQTYAEALGRDWSLPPVDRRQAAVMQLREAAILRLRDLYEETPTQRRDGLWCIALEETWKHRQTPCFDVCARNDLVAQRVADAADYHWTALADWLGHDASAEWSPRCEIRVHATRDDLHMATGTRGLTNAVSVTRMQGSRVLLRRLDVFQADPWLLNSTLPHELTHLLLAEMAGHEPLPLAIDEGLALHAEVPARRLMYRLRLPPALPDPPALLRAQTLPPDVESFYAQSAALAGWLLTSPREDAPAGDVPAAVRWLLAACRNVPQSAGWSKALGLHGDAESAAAWAEWYAVRRAPYRMPLMVLVEPTTQPRPPRK